MRYIMLAFLPFLALFMQSTIFRTFSLYGAIPDMILVLVVFYALFNGAHKAAVYGVLCGLMEDLYIGRFIGINAVSKGITAYITGRLQGSVFKENIIVGILGVIGGTVINSGILFILSVTSFGVFNLDHSIFMDMCYQGIYNTLIAIPMYVWYYHSFNRGFLRKTGER